MLLVTPLAAPALCFDLRRGCSLVEHFVSAGRPTYLVEYGAGLVQGPQPRHGALDRRGGAGRDPRGVRARRRPSGARGRLEPRRDLRAADRRRPARPADRLGDRRRLAGRREAGAAGRAAAAAAQPHRRPRRWSPAPTRRWAAPRSRWCGWAFQLSSFQKLVTKPLAIATHLDDADFLAQLEAVDRFTANMIAYPGRTLRAALPPVREGQRPRPAARSTSATGPSRWPTITAPGAGLRRRHRRHRADPVGARRWCRC